MSDGERDEAREAFAEALAGWGMTAAEIADTLEATAFGLGMVDLRPAAGDRSPGVAIVVDDRRDRELRELFAWRERTSDEDYMAAWEVEQAPLVRVILGPDEQALVRFAVMIRKPVRLERRFLFTVHLVAPQLAKLQVPGTGIWLVPATAIERAAAREGPGDSYDAIGLGLRAGVVARAVPSIDEALAHVGAPRESAGRGR